jgi:hypothetical protein
MDVKADKIIVSRGMTGGQSGVCLPNQLVHNRAHLVGEAVLMPAIRLCGNGGTALGALDVLGQCTPVRIRQLPRHVSIGRVVDRHISTRTQKSMSR